MKSYEFSDSYLGSIPLEVSAVNKAVYLFIVLFRGCTSDDVVSGLGFDKRLVSSVLSDLLERKMIRMKGGRLHLPEKEPVLPLERFSTQAEKHPVWYDGN